MAGQAWGATQYAASCARDDVYTAYTAAAKDDTVMIPSGSCDWGTTYIAMSSSKPVKIAGSGNGSEATSNTILTCNNASYGCFYVNTGADPSAYAFSLSNMRLISTTGSVITNVTGTGYGWRIYNNYFYKSTPNTIISLTTINTGGDYQLFGLIDGNTFYNTKILPTGSAAGSAEQSWQADPQWGTNNAIFVENNTFYGPTKGTGLRVDSNGGARIVIRYNDFQDSYIMAHSPCESTVRGTRSYEIYNNKMSSTTTSDWASAMYLRAGSHVVTRNQILGLWEETENGNGAPAFDVRRLADTACSSATWGLCDGDSAYDTNTGSGDSAGYMCLDQIGAGKGAYGSQTSDPVYVWGNVGGQTCVGGANIYKVCTSNDDCPDSTCTAGTTPTPNTPVVRTGSGYHIVKDRDYFESARPDWSAYTCPHPLADPLAQGACATTGDTMYGKAGYTLTGGGSDTTAPIFSSASLNGTALTVVLSEDVTVNTNTGFAISCTGGAATLSYVSESNGVLSYTISRSIAASEGYCSLAYTAGENYIEDGAENDLASFSDATVTNLTPAAPPTSTLTVTKTGAGCTVTSSPAGINCGSTCEYAFNTDTPVTLGGWSEDGWFDMTYGGDCDANGDVTVATGGKTCTATCTPKFALGGSGTATVGGSGTMTLGVSVPETCTTPDSNTNIPNSIIIARDTATDYIAGSMSFTSTSAYSLKSFTVPLRRTWTDPSLTITGKICTDNSGVPSATCTTADATVATSALTTSMQNIRFAIAAGYSISNSTRYHLVLSSALGTSSAYWLMGFLNTGTEAANVSVDGENWSSQDNASTAGFTTSTCVSE